MHRAALIVATLLLIAAAARAIQSGYQTRLEGLRAAAADQRQKLGLDKDRSRLYASYPTPEIVFPGAPVPIACGQSGEVSVGGQFPPDTAFVLRRDDVQIASAKLGDDGWHATLNAAADAVPGSVVVEAVAPVSGASVSKRIAVVRGKLSIALEFEDGWKATLTPKSERLYEAKWSNGEQTRSSLASLTVEPGTVRVSFQPGPEQLQAMKQHAGQLAGAAMGPELKQALETMQACGKLPQSEQLACIQGTQGAMQKAAEASKTKAAELDAQYQASLPKEAWACTRVDLRGALGHLAGKAECTQPIKVTAVATCTAD